MNDYTLCYHNIVHINKVYISVCTLIAVNKMVTKSVDISDKDISALFYSFLFHDIFYSYGLEEGQNEILSARIFMSWWNSQDNEAIYNVYGSITPEQNFTSLVSNLIINTTVSHRKTLAQDSLYALLADADVMYSFINIEKLKESSNLIRGEYNYKVDNSNTTPTLNYSFIFVTKIVDTGFVSGAGKQFNNNYVYIKENIIKEAAEWKDSI